MSQEPNNEIIDSSTRKLFEGKNLAFVSTSPPNRAPGEKRVILKIKPERVFHMK